jgi:(p)ppGpp synthase/HD superfamily hydrolase
MNALERALQIALTAHAGQRHKDGAPYILHPLRVMFAVDGEAARIVALLHDVLEDSSVTREDLLREGFTNDVVEAVELLTKKDQVPEGEYLAGIAGNSLAREVKLADLRDNSRLEALAQLDGKSAVAKFQDYLRSWIDLHGRDPQ